MDKQVFFRGIFSSPDTPEEQLAPTRAIPSHFDLPAYNYTTLPALICVGAHMVSHVNIFTSVMDIAKTGGFFLFMCCTYLMVYIVFFNVSFFWCLATGSLICNHKRYTDGSVHTLWSVPGCTYSARVHLYEDLKTLEKCFLHSVPPQYCDKD